MGHEEKYHTTLAMMYLDTISELAVPDQPLPSPNDHQGVLAETRAKLGRLLKQSCDYNISALLAKVLQMKSLLEERVILYGKLGQHDSALRTIVHEMKDFSAAESYCAEFSKQANEDLYLILFKVLLDMQSTKNRLSPQVFAFLDKHASKLHPAKTLPLLPQDTPLCDMYQYLQKSIRSSSHTYREGQIIRNLSKSDNLQVTCRLIHAKDNCVTIHRDTMCLVCNKRIGDKVFAYFPNGSIVHFKCFEDKHIDPVTNRNFKLAPASR